MIKQISHLGIAVNDLEEAREFYRSVFKLKSSEPIIGCQGTIKISMVKVGNVLIELLQPLKNEGPVAKFLEKRGEGLHHICYEVEDIKTEIAFLKETGMEILGEPRPGAEGLSVFLHPSKTHGILVELVEKTKTRAD